MAVKRGHERSDVMKNANSAATRMGNWSPAKKEFAHRVTGSGTLGEDQISSKSTSGDRQQPGPIEQSAHKGNSQSPLQRVRNGGGLSIRLHAWLFRGAAQR